MRVAVLPAVEAAQACSEVSYNAESRREHWLRKLSKAAMTDWTFWILTASAFGWKQEENDLPSREEPWMSSSCPITECHPCSPVV